MRLSLEADFSTLFHSLHTYIALRTSRSDVLNCLSQKWGQVQSAASSTRIRTMRRVLCFGIPAGWKCTRAGYSPVGNHRTPRIKLSLGLSPGVRQTVKALLTVRWNSIVMQKTFPARWAPAGEAAAGSAGAQPAKE